MVFMRVVAVATMFVGVACSRPPSESETTALGANVNSQLRSTYWKLTSLGDKPVTVADSQREPHIVLAPDSKQLSGSGGCNRMFGTYELNGDAISFSGVGATKMACMDGMDIETSFFAALPKVAKWQISGQHLELRDASGSIVARFDAKAK